MMMTTTTTTMMMMTTTMMMMMTTTTTTTMMTTMMMMMMMMTTTMMMMTIMKSYEHSEEVELAWPHVDCVNSIVLYTSYELGDCNSNIVRERKNRSYAHEPVRGSRRPLGAALPIFVFV